MERDFDYVTMSDYSADMKETADHAVAAIGYMRRQLKNKDRLIWALLKAAGGDVRFPESYVHCEEPGKVEMRSCIKDLTLRVRVLP